MKTIETRKEHSVTDDATSDATPDDEVPRSGAGDPADLVELGFAGAMSELEQIVAELESDALDVDLLADRVERAAILVGWCRDRIDGTRLRVEEILERLD